MSDPSVLVSGAGPTGLLLAADLSRRGVPFRIVDAAPAPSPLSRAIVVHARTLEILRDFGAADELVSRGVPLSRVRMFRGSAPILDVDFSQLDTPFPYLLCVHQTETEQVLANLVEGLGGQIERGVRYTGMSQDADGVNSRLEHADGREEWVRSRWLVGCDGAHSQVRKDGGFAFSGAAYAEDLWLVDCRLDCDYPSDGLTSFFAPSGFLACFPMAHDRVRLICTAPPEYRDGHEPTLADLQRAWDDRTELGGALADAVWVARFKIHARQVKRYRNGRVLLAGDAAHIHSPVGGQGMNTGLQDAHNLGWRLAQLHRGGRDTLDVYSDERHAVGQRLLRGTDIATKVGTWRNPVLRKIRDTAARIGASIPALQHLVLRGVAELDVHYRGSAGVGGSRTFLTGLRPGDRFPDPQGGLSGETRSLVLVGPRAHFDDLVGVVSGLAEPIAIHYRGEGPQGIYLIRPDLYVGWRGQIDDGPALLKHLRS